MKGIKNASELLTKNHFAFNYPETVGRNIINVYQKNNKNKESGVYSIECECGLPYIGQTGKNKLSGRVIEHKRSLKYAQESSAIFQHCFNNNHRMKWEESRLIFKTSCNYI